MKTYLLGLFILMILGVNLSAQEASMTSGDLTVIVTGLENDEGKVMIALSNTQEDYEKKGEPLRGAQATIKDNKAIWTFNDISAGEYAVKVFHDQDDDDELDTNFIGIPSEDYGFSNNAKGSFGPASWEDANFLFGAKSDTIEINVE